MQAAYDTREPDWRSRVGRVIGDILAAAILLMVTAGVGFVLLLSQLRLDFGGATEPGAAEVESTASTVYILGGLGLAAAAVVAVLALRHRLWVTGLTQACVVVATIVLYVVGNSAAEETDAPAQPSPASEHYKKWGGPCYSGGDSAECPGG